MGRGGTPKGYEAQRGVRSRHGSGCEGEAGVKGTKRGYEVHAYDVLSLPTETESIQRGVNGNHNGEPPWGNATGKRYGETLRGNATGMG